MEEIKKDLVTSSKGNLQSNDSEYVRLVTQISYFQNMFRMIGFGENLGSGFPLILSAWNEKHWLKPELIEQRELMQVKLVLTIEQKDFVKDFVKELTERQKVILDLVALEPSLSAKAISEKISKQAPVTERTIQSDLAQLKKMGILIREGGRKEGHWIIMKEKKER